MRNHPVRHHIGNLVGRDAEVAQLRGAVERIGTDPGALFLLSGPPDIGKSRLAEEISAYASGRKVRVLWARCWEEEGAPVFWPWVQLLRALADGREAEPNPFESHNLDVSGENPGETRFRLFDSVVRFLRQASTTGPLVLVFDDLHWAGEPSLLLLRFLTHQLHDMNVLVLATYRDDCARSSTTTQLFAEIARDGRRLVLNPLTVEESSALVKVLRGSADTDPDLLAGIHRASEGVPLFIEALVSLAAQPRTAGGAARLKIPEEIREAIRMRLAPVGAEAIRILAVAAVCGREFDADVVERAAGAKSRTRSAVDRAILAGLVRAQENPRRYEFSHGLIRQTLYDDLSREDRSNLHRRVAESLEEMGAGEQGARVAELAYHYCASETEGSSERALDCSERAAHIALGAGAYESAIEHYERALDLAQRTAEDPRRCCEISLGLGDAVWRAGRPTAAAKVFRTAAQLARPLGDGVLLARAALGLGLVHEESGIASAGLATALEEGLEALGPADSVLRSRLLGRLAGALYFTTDELRREDLSLESIEIARRLGDRRALLAALQARLLILWNADHLSDRIDITEEALQLARHLRDCETEREVRGWKIFNLLELGEVQAANVEIDIVARDTAASRLPRFRWKTALRRAMQALLCGQFDRVEALASEAAAHGAAEQVNAAQFFGVQLFALRREQGRLSELRPSIEAIAQAHPELPIWRCGVALLHAESGSREQALAEFDRLADGGFGGLPRDTNWLPSLALLAEVCAFLGDRTNAVVLYDLLRPYADRQVVIATEAACYGAVSHYLGLLAATRGDWQRAEADFQHARAMHTRMGARPWVARTELALADCLHRSGVALARAAALARSALDTATELGMTGVAARAAALQQVIESSGQPAAVELRTAVGEPTQRANVVPLARRGERPPRQSVPLRVAPRPPAPDGAAENIFRREGDWWTIAYAGRVLRVRDARGLHYIVQLLEHAERPFLAIDLASDRFRPHPDQSPVVPTGDGGEILDAKARAAYESRLRELRDDLDEATRNNDNGRAEHARTEIAALSEQLAGAFGLGGRSRRAGSELERARSAVTQRIRQTIKSIHREHPALGHHLDTCIRTGVYCVYEPPPGNSLRWIVA